MASRLTRFSWLPGGLTATLVVLAGHLAGAPTIEPVEFALYDSVMSMAGTAPSQDIVIVTVGEDSIDKLGAYPWRLDVHASLVDRLHADGAHTIVFADPSLSRARSDEAERVQDALDLLESSNLANAQQARQLRRSLTEIASRRGPETRLAQAMLNHGGVVLATDTLPPAAAGAAGTLPANRLAPADAAALKQATERSLRASATTLVAAAGGVGHLHFDTDRDRTVRTDVAAVRVEDALLPSLAVAAVASSFRATPQQIVFEKAGSLHVGGRHFALESGLKTRGHYFPASGTHSFPSYPYWAVLNGEIAATQLRDKIVIVDRPADEAIATPVGELSPALVVASTIASLREGHMYSRTWLATAFDWAAAAGVIAFTALVLPQAPLALGAIATLLLLGILLIAEFGLLHSARLWVHFMVPCAAAVAGYGIYALGEFLHRANARGGSRDASANLRALGRTFQNQGQLDLAFETYRRCPLDAPTMEQLYSLGLDFERRRQMQKAEAVYSYIATRDPNYRDLRVRRARVKDIAQREPPTEPPAPSLRTDPATYDLDTPFTGRRLGRYEIEREVGKGAMGVVYLGRDPKINRIVAIKAIPLAEEFEEEDLAEARARFFREAEMAGRLNHPAIVTVYDAGEDQGLAYIAMEYLHGQHLSHYTDPSRLLPPRQVMLLMARVADALHYAHRQNVVHRDIKPANIMFNPDTDGLKITDFGIARLTDTSRTKTGIVLGTPSFMSPEQLEGRDLDGRSDQFALGVSLFQLLCGHLPFRADSMPRLMQKIATEPHPSVRLVRPELPESIDRILDRVLAKNANYRYATCGELAMALRECAGAGEQRDLSEPRHEWLIP